MTLNRHPGRLLLTGVVLVAAGVALGCASRSVEVAPSIVAGSSAVPREVNLIARDYAFVPGALELVPGETILLHVINGGLVVHEAIIGDTAVQDAWEAAEAATVGAPPGPTPVVTVPSEVSGVRVVVESGQRVDLAWTVPLDAAGRAGDGASRPAWLVGCHIPGHWAKGMQIPIHWVLAPTGAAASNPRS